jgi:hypothetical protein
VDQNVVVWHPFIVGTPNGVPQRVVLEVVEGERDETGAVVPGLCFKKSCPFGGDLLRGHAPTSRTTRCALVGRNYRPGELLAVIPMPLGQHTGVGLVFGGDIGASDGLHCARDAVAFERGGYS